MLSFCNYTRHPETMDEARVARGAFTSFTFAVTVIFEPMLCSRQSPDIGTDSTKKLNALRALPVAHGFIILRY